MHIEEYETLAKAFEQEAEAIKKQTGGAGLPEVRQAAILFRGLSGVCARVAHEMNARAQKPAEATAPPPAQVRKFTPGGAPVAATEGGGKR